MPPSSLLGRHRVLPWTQTASSTTPYGVTLTANRLEIVGTLMASTRLYASRTLDDPVAAASSETSPLLTSVIAAGSRR